MVAKYFRLLLFILIFVFVPKVYAFDYNVSSIVSSPVGGANSGKYAGTELNGDRGAFSIGTRYNGTLTRIEYNLPVPSAIDPDCWPTNMTYTITMNMATEDWRNRFGAVSVNDSLGHEFSNGNVSYISMKKIKFTFKIPSSDSTCHNYVYVNLPSRELFTPFTGETNWNLSSIIVSDTLTNGSSGGSSGGSSTPTPTPGATNQDIINNQNQNTQDLIDNQNNNTQSIIDSQNQNTSDIIENANNNTSELVDHMNENATCPSGTLQLTKEEFGDTRGYLTSDGSIYDTGNYSISPYLKIKPNTEYSLKFSLSTSTAYYCLYGGSKNVISCSPLSPASQTFTTDNNTYFMRISLRDSRVVSLTGPVCNDWQKEAMEKLKDVNQSIYDSINDDNIASGTGSDFFNDFSTSDNGGISAIVTKPLVIVNNLLSNNSSCTNLQLPTFMGVSNAYLPSGCILWDNAPSSVITLWNIFVCGIGAYFILKDLFKIIENLKNPDNDKVEVIDL